MSVPANITADLQAVSDDIDAEASAKTAADQAAQANDTAQKALTDATAKTQTDEQKLIDDIHAWFGGTPAPAPQDVKSVMTQLKKHLGRRK